MFSKKATKIDEIFNVDLTVTTTVKLTVKILSIFVAFSENVNFTSKIVTTVRLAPQKFKIFMEFA